MRPRGTDAHLPVWCTIRLVALGVLGLIVALVVAAGYAAHAADERAVREAVARADREMSGGHFAAARKRLEDLPERLRRRGAVGLRLGACLEALGRRDAAVAVWWGVPEGSPERLAAVARATDALINSGRYDPAEALIEPTLATATAGAPGWYEAARAAARLYRFEGRTADVRRQLRLAWPFSPDPAGLLKELWLLDASPAPFEALGNALAKADPNDLRVLLARANLARDVGRLDEAQRLIEGCVKARPDDPIVWRSRLQLAQIRDDAAGVVSACEHVPAAALDPVDRLRLRAWLARRLSPDREAAEWTALLKLVPGDPTALDRLAGLAAARNDAPAAADFRARKAASDRAKDRVRAIVLNERDLPAFAEELEGLNRTLGRAFDAEAWALVEDRPQAGPIGIIPLALRPDRPPQGTLRTLCADVIPKTLPAGPGTGPRVTPPVFVDAAESAGLRFTFDNGATDLKQLPETMSGGVGLLDYDGDGFLDVYAVQGGPCREDPSAERGPDRLFRNKGDGTFEDATERAGIAALPRSYGLAVTVGDYDNDGDPDLFLSRLRSYQLLRNRGDGTFEDATGASGLAGPRDNPTSAAFADLDDDGDLDLYVCHYMIWDPANPTLCANERGGYFYCDPSRVQPAKDHVFRNDGGRFTDVTDAAGFVDPRGRGLGVIAADLDDDGRIDLFVANDGTANYHFRNLGGFMFEEIGHESGAAGNAEGGYRAGMGVACGDLDGDGRPDVLVTNFYGEGTTFYRNLGGGFLADRSTESGFTSATRHLLGFGVAMLDYDADGRPDVFQVDGHVNDNRPHTPYPMATKLFAGVGGGKVVDAVADTGPPWSKPIVGRGLAVGDIDNDGDVDAVVLPQNDPLMFFRNDTPGGRRLVLRLEGSRSNRDAVGAVVTVRAGGRDHSGRRIGGGSYQSANDARLHFGLGGADRIESVRVRWPSGREQTFRDLAPDRAYHLIEGTPEARPLKGYRAE